MRVLGIALLATATVSMAFAQGNPTTNPVVDLSERYIADAQGAGIFVVDLAPDVALPRVRHQPSGLLCTLSSQFTAARIRIVDDASPRGDNVICSTSSMYIGQAIYATRISPDITLDEDMQRFEADALRTVPSLRPNRSAPTLAGIPGVEERVVTLSNGSALTYLRVAHVRGWSVRLKISSQLAAADLLVRQSNAVWEDAVISVAEASNGSR